MSIFLAFTLLQLNFQWRRGAHAALKIFIPRQTCHRDDEEEEEDDDEPEFIRAPKKGLLRPSWSTQKSTNGGKYL